MTKSFFTVLFGIILAFGLDAQTPPKLSQVFLVDQEAKTSKAQFQNDHAMSNRQDLSISTGYNHPFFCRIESKLEKKSGQALRFRLGTVEVVDQYEGKK